MIDDALDEARGLELSRLTPVFTSAGGEQEAPIDDPYVSRKSVLLRDSSGGVEVYNGSGADLRIGGEPLAAGSRVLSAAQVNEGIDVELGDRVVLWLHRAVIDRSGRDTFGLFGESLPMERLRVQIRRVAEHLHGSVLIRGETGSGKELVARALHAFGPRSAGPFLALNMAAIPASTAAAELFGHVKGAFTGASEARLGHFQRASSGVLFLDEIGETPDDVQPMLLRALEQFEAQPVGGTPEPIDVVVIAATDAPLDAAHFRPALLHRLSAASIDVPPLRDRRADIGPLFARFVSDVLPEEVLDQTLKDELWLAAWPFASLLRFNWPGNVRQLANVARQLATIAKSGARVGAEDVQRLLGFEEPVAGVAPAAIDEATLVGALRAHKFQLNRAAAALGISRSGLDALIARSRKVRKAKDLTREEIASAASACSGDVDRMAAQLEVSPRGLRLRMTQLGI